MALSSVLADPLSEVLVLECGGEPVGWAHCIHAPGPGGRRLEIRRFYVDGRWHGTGAAAFLMEAVRDRARGTRAETLWLAVWERNHRARAFYEKHGFRRTGAQPFRFGTDLQTDDVLSRPVSFDLSLAIIAGGSAQRLGGACKPLLVVGGRTVLERLLALRTLADEVLLVSEDARLPDAGLRRVSDVLPGRGAPGGVQAAMARAARTWVLAVAGDMPFLDGRAIRPLLEARTDGADAVAYAVSGRLEPLAALYRSALAPRWAEALARAGTSFRVLWNALRGVTLDERVLREATGDTRAVVSLNLPADVAKWVDRPPVPRS